MKVYKRSNKDVLIAGVCGGLSEYTGADLLLIRFAFIILTFCGGAGICIYFALWIFAPKQDEEHSLEGQKSTEKEQIEELSAEAEPERLKQSGKLYPPIETKEKHKNKENSWSSVFWGVMIFVIGVLWLGSSLNLFDFRFYYIWRLWPIVLCYAGINIIRMNIIFKRVLNILLVVATLLLILYIGSCPDANMYPATHFCCDFWD